jgi:hypothetical protein
MFNSLGLCTPSTAQKATYLENTKFFVNWISLRLETAVVYSNIVGSLTLIWITDYRASFLNFLYFLYFT